MNVLALVGVCGAIASLLFFLAIWQGKIDDRERKKALAALKDAADRGSSRALAQFPQIDEQLCIGCGSCIAACPEEQVLALVNGVARVVHGARCIGHGRCAEVCPIQAIQVGLGDTSQRTDLPALSERNETSVPGLFIAGELGGLALIRIAVQQGIQAVRTIAGDLSESDRGGGSLDLLIIGAGPAGIAASLEAKKRQLEFLTIDQDDIGGTVRKYPRKKLTLVGAVDLPLHGRVQQSEFLKEELIEFWERLVDEHELPVRPNIRLVAIEGQAGDFTVRTTQGALRARRVLLALGRRGTPRRLDVPGEESERVLYQLCDAASYQGEEILVVGGGDSAIEAATALADQTGNKVILSYRKASFFRLKSRNEERIHEYLEQGKLEILFESSVVGFEDGVALLDTPDGSTRLAMSYAFVLLGGDAPHELLSSLGVRFGGARQSQPA